MVGDAVKLLDIERYYKEKKGIGPHGESLYSVFVPVVSVEGSLHVLFQVRAYTMRHQPGEIAFPGGKVEPGESFLQAAIRETCEELGVMPEHLSVYGPLDVQINSIQRMIFPFVGTIHDFQVDRLDLNRDEVEGVVTVPLDFFIHTHPQVHNMFYQGGMEEGFPFEKIKNHETYKNRKLVYPVYFYEYHDLTIWGLTAKIIRDLVLELGGSKVYEWKLKGLTE